MSLFKNVGSMGAAVAKRISSPTIDSEIPGSNPGHPPVERHRDLYTPIYACRLQWAIIRCGKHVHADYMSLNMILTAISHAVSTVRRVSRSAVYYTHQTNSLPLSKP